MVHFEVIKSSQKSRARAGRLHTNHGVIETPVFMPCGTQGTVKGLTPEMLEDIGVSILLGNTYHLGLRPGVELIKSFGGLHDFMNWKHPILTDSGGYQVFSLSKLRKIDADGVTFRSHLDGSKHRFTPESVVDLQLGFNSDIMMPLDICTHYGASEGQTEAELLTTLSWEKQAITHWRSHHQGQHLFAIVQGGMFKHLRKQSAEALVEMDFPGYAIGGLSVGEPLPLMDEMVDYTTDFLPKDKPRYLMGVGLPENFDAHIASGIDMFDCVIPTRLARHGQVFTSTEGRINIKNKQYESDHGPIDSVCGCYACKFYSRAYIRHLFRSEEMLGLTLMSYHNVYYLVHYVKRIREQILAE